MQRIALNDRIPLSQEQCADLLDLEEALAALEKIDPRKAAVVISRYFGDMTEAEIAETLGIGTRTVKRDWEFARAWLKEYLSR
jgi:RNA polymerase sigma factor (sigma-70 family)